MKMKMKTLTLSLTFAAFIAVTPAAAFTVYQLQSDGSAAHYLPPGANSGGGLQLNNQQDNGVTLYQSESSNFSLSGGPSYFGNSARPNSLTHENRGPRNANAPFTGYYLRDR